MIKVLILNPQFFYLPTILNNFYDTVSTKVVDHNVKTYSEEKLISVGTQLHIKTSLWRFKKSGFE